MQIYSMKDLLLCQEHVNNFDRAMDIKVIMDEEKKKITAMPDSLRSLDLFHFRMHFEEPAFGLPIADQY